MLFSCSNLIEKPEIGNISFTLPFRTSTTTENQTTVDIASLNFSIFITNCDTKEEIKDVGLKGKTYSYELNPGFYDVVISAYLPSAPDSIIYEGKYEKAEIVAGKSTDVSITLKKVIAEPDEPENPKEEFNTWTIDISDIVGDGYIADNSKYGDGRYCYYQSGAFDISSCFQDGLPKKDDVLNLEWKGKCDTNIKNLHFLVIDYYYNKNWTDLISEEDRLTPIKQNIKADEEFEINYSVKLSETPKDTVKIYFAYGKTDASGPSYLYQQDKNEYRHSDLRIENGVVKMTQPGSKFMEYLKSEGCDGYVAGVISGKNSEGYDNWLCGRIYKLDEDAFSDADFTYELYRAYDSIQDGKIFSIVDYYKNVENESERIWISQDISSMVEYNTIFEESPISILGNKFGISQCFGGASASSDGMIEWRYENNEEYPGAGWFVGNLDLSEWDVIRIEFDSEYPDDSLYVSLIQDGCTLDYHSDYQAETNVFEINLDGTKSTYKVPEDSVWDTSKPITEILIRTHLTEVEGTKKAKVKSVELKKYPQVSDHISVENVENGIQVTLKKANSSEIWLTSAVDIIEDGKETGIPFSFFINNVILMNQIDTLSFVYPFTKAGSKYKFSVAPDGNTLETVAIVADKTSELKLTDTDIVSDFQVLYEEKDDTNGAKRIIKLNSNPFEIFSDVSKFSYMSMCVNVYNADMKWIYNFNVTPDNVNEYIENGIDFMSKSSGLGKTPQEFKDALNPGEKLIIIPHIEFSVDNENSSEGALLKSLGNFKYDWTRCE